MGFVGGLASGVLGAVGLGGARGSSSSTTVNNTTQNPYEDQWIRDKFSTGQSQLDELTRFMNERKAALATPQYYDVGGGQSVRQDQFGEFITNQIGKQTGDFNRQLAEYQTGVDKSISRLGQQQSAARDSLKSTYDARLADISTAAGMRDQALANITAAGSARDARLADITSAAGANEQALRAQSEALAKQGERARAGQAANQAAIQAATQRNQQALQQATSQYQAGQQANEAAIRAQQEQMAQQTQASRAAQEQNPLVAGVKSKIKPRNLFRYGTGGSFNRSGLRISSLNI